MTTAELIEKLERAGGPTRELFEEAFYACFPPPTHTTIPLVKSINAKSGRFCPDAHSDWSLRLAKFQTMLDAEAWESAALMLVPVGWITQIVRDFNDDDDFFSSVTLIDSFSVRRGCAPEEERAINVSRGARLSFQDPTAIALCIAALKAKEADNE